MGKLDEVSSELQTEAEGGEETESAGDRNKPVGVDEAAGGEEQERGRGEGEANDDRAFCLRDVVSLPRARTIAAEVVATTESEVSG